MHAFLGHDERRPAPLILGHEAAGVVVQGPIEGKRVLSATCENAKLVFVVKTIFVQIKSANHLDATATRCVRRTCSYF